MSNRLAVLWVFVALLAVIAGAGSAAIVWPDARGAGRVLGSAVILLLHFTAIVLAGLAVGRCWSPRIARAGIVLSALSAAAWVAFVWLEPGLSWQVEEKAIPFLFLLTSSAALGVHIPFMRAVPLRGLFGRLVRRGTLASGGLLVALIAVLAVAVLFDRGESEWWGRAIGITLLLAAVGTVGVPVVGLIEHLARRAHSDALLQQHVPVRLACPRCGTEQSIDANRQQPCRGCGLQMTVLFEEPRCTCGYLLHGLAGGACPECGRPVPPDAAWSPAEPSP